MRSVFAAEWTFRQCGCSVQWCGANNVIYFSCEALLLPDKIIPQISWPRYCSGFHGRCVGSVALQHLGSFEQLAAGDVHCDD